MRAQLYSTRKPPVAAIVGTWDPLVPAHYDLFRALNRHAREASLASLAVVLHPAPAELIKERVTSWPRYHDLPARLAMMQAAGLDEVLVVHFRSADVDAPAQAFFAVLDAHVVLHELWLGATQSLGRGPQGSYRAIRLLAARRGCVLERLPPSTNTEPGYAVRQFLREGRLREAIRTVGQPPVWGRPRSGVLRLNWRAGGYTVVPLASPTSIPKRSDAMAVRLERDEKGWARLEWPGRDIEWLAFLAGPGDR